MIKESKLSPEECNMICIRTSKWKYVHFPSLPCLLFDLEHVDKGLGVVFYEQQDKEDLGENPEKFKVHMVDEGDPNFQQHNEFVVS